MTGLPAFVVQDALELTWQLTRASSFTPISTVAPTTPASSGSSFNGAETTTRFAPAAKCTFAFS